MDKISTITAKVEQREEVKIIAKKIVGLQNIIEGTMIKYAARELSETVEGISNWTNQNAHYGIAPVTPLQDNPEMHIYYIGIQAQHLKKLNKVKF
jgi:hypothetical protein